MLLWVSVIRPLLGNFAISAFTSGIIEEFQELSSRTWLITNRRNHVLNCSFSGRDHSSNFRRKKLMSFFQHSETWGFALLIQKVNFHFIETT